MAILNDIFVNLNISDKTFIYQIINTVLENENTSNDEKYNNFTYLNNLINKLLEENPNYRPDLKNIVEDIKLLYDNLDKIKFIDIINIHNIDFNPDNYKSTYIMCFCRTIFDKYYYNRIYYKDPKYALNIAYGDNPWFIFLKAIKINNAYII